MFERRIISDISRQRSRYNGLVFVRIDWDWTFAGWGLLNAKASAAFIVPGRPVISLRCLIEAGVQPILGEFEAFFDDECGVGEIDQILMGDTLILESVAEDAAQEGDVGASANLQMEIGSRSGT